MLCNHFCEHVQKCAGGEGLFQNACNARSIGGSGEQIYTADFETGVSLQGSQQSVTVDAGAPFDVGQNAAGQAACKDLIGFVGVAGGGAFHGDGVVLCHNRDHEGGGQQQAQHQEQHGGRTCPLSATPPIPNLGTCSPSQSLLSNPASPSPRLQLMKSGIYFEISLFFKKKVQTD